MVIEHIWLNCSILDYRKNSSFLPNPAGLEADLTLPPTSQYRGPYAGIEDYGLK
jgi:hypothetical protein